VANGTLFHYFHNKDRLIVHIYRDGLTQMLEHCQSGLEKIAGIRGILKHVWSQSVEWALQHPNMYLYMYQFELSPYFKQFEWEGDKIRPIESIFYQAIQKGLICDLPLSLMVRLLDQYVFSFVSYLKDHPDECGNADLKNLMFETLWLAIRGDE
jgi:AcrR family transcriptional regulator